MIMLKKLKSFLTAKTRRGWHNKSNPLNAVDDVNSKYDGDGNIRSSRALNDANDVAKLLIKMHEARMSSDYLTANNVHNEDIVEPVGPTKNQGPFGSKLSVSRLSPVPVVVKAFRRISAGSTASTATTATTADTATTAATPIDTDSSMSAINTSATNATSLANASAGSTNAMAKTAGLDIIDNKPDDLAAYESNLTPLDLSALEFSEPAVIPALCLPPTIDSESFNIKAAAAAATGPRRSSRISVFEVLENFASLSNASGNVNISNTDDTAVDGTGENSLLVPPNSPCTPAKGSDLLQPKHTDEYRWLKPWGRHRICSLPELSDVFRPVTAAVDEDEEDIFGPIILLAPATRSHHRLHNRTVSLGAAPSNGIANYRKKTYELADPRIYPKDSCFTTGDTCPCLPTLAHPSTVPASPVSEKNASLTAYLQDLARELNGMSRSSSPSATFSVADGPVEDSIFSDLTSSMLLNEVDWPEGHTSLSIEGYSNPTEVSLMGRGRLLSPVSLPVVAASSSAASLQEVAHAKLKEDAVSEIYSDASQSHSDHGVKNRLQLDTTDGSLPPGFGAIVARDTFGPGINVVSDLSLAGTVSLDMIRAAGMSTGRLPRPAMDKSHVSMDKDTSGHAASLSDELAHLEVSPSLEASLVSLTQQLQDTIFKANKHHESPRAVVTAATAGRMTRRRSRTEGWLLSPPCSSFERNAGRLRKNAPPSKIPRMRMTTLPIM